MNAAIHTRSKPLPSPVQYCTRHCHVYDVACVGCLVAEGVSFILFFVLDNSDRIAAKRIFTVNRQVHVCTPCAFVVLLIQCSCKGVWRVCELWSLRSTWLAGVCTACKSKPQPTARAAPNALEDCTLPRVLQPVELVTAHALAHPAESTESQRNSVTVASCAASRQARVRVRVSGKADEGR